VKAFLKDQEHIDIDDTMHKRIRKYPDFFPQAVTISRMLSLHILTTGRKKNKLWCLYHHAYNCSGQNAKGTVVNPKNYLFTGMLGEDVRDTNTGRAALGCMDCGCTIEDSLWYLIFWKTWRQSTI
jgi:hypothetical protein